MPNLATEAIHGWAADCSPIPTSNSPTNFFREIESRPDVERSLIKLGQALDEASDTNAAALRTALVEHTGRDALRRILAQLGPGRMVRILDWLSSSALPEAKGILAALFDSADDSDVLVLREVLQALHQRELLGRVFGEDRVGVLLSACRIVHKEPSK